MSCPATPRHVAKRTWELNHWPWVHAWLLYQLPLDTVRLKWNKASFATWNSKRFGRINPCDNDHDVLQNKSKLCSFCSLSCLFCLVVRCSWDLSMSEDWATCWALTVPVAARCPALPWCLGTALTDDFSTQSTCWHTVAQRKRCCWTEMWVGTGK